MAVVARGGHNGCLCDLLLALAQAADVVKIWRFDSNLRDMDVHTRRVKPVLAFAACHQQLRIVVWLAAHTPSVSLLPQFQQGLLVCLRAQRV